MLAILVDGLPLMLKNVGRLWPRDCDAGRPRRRASVVIDGGGDQKAPLMMG